MWFGQLPFLTGVQAQQGFAFRHDVNLLASGSNDANVGSSGTGIYAGRAGAVQRVMSSSPKSRLLVSEIKKLPPRVLPNGGAVDFPTDLAGIQLKRDRSSYLYVPIVTATFKGIVSDNQTIDGDDGHECRFQYKIVTTAPLTEQVSYTYQMVVFKGLQSGKRPVRICAVVACTHPNDTTSCGTMWVTWYRHVVQLVPKTYTSWTLESFACADSTPIRPCSIGTRLRIWKYLARLLALWAVQIWRCPAHWPQNYFRCRVTTLHTQKALGNFGFTIRQILYYLFTIFTSNSARITNVTIQLKTQRFHRLLTFGVYSMYDSAGVVWHVSWAFLAFSVILTNYSL